MQKISDGISAITETRPDILEDAEGVIPKLFAFYLNYREMSFWKHFENAIFLDERKEVKPCNSVYFHIKIRKNCKYFSPLKVKSLIYNKTWFIIKNEKKINNLRVFLQIFQQFFLVIFLRKFMPSWFTMKLQLIMKLWKMYEKGKL